MEQRLDRFVEPDSDEPQDPIELPVQWGIHFALPYLLYCFDIIDITNWQTLPEAGGLLDQDALLMDDIGLLFLIRRAVWEDKLSR
jgi:hypothetical protein